VLSDDPELIGRVHPHLRDRHLAGLFVSGSDGAQAFAVHQSRAPAQVGEYVHFAVWAHLESGNRDKALRGLQSLASNPHGGEGTDRARAALQALQSNQDTAEVLALLNGMKKSTSP
jgi:hypothetical protein